MSARDFSRAVGVADNNTQNYLEPRFAQPKADYLEKVLLHFESINPSWLLAGRGEPFLSKLSDSVELSATSTKNNSGNAIGINHGKATQQQGGLPGNEAALLKEIEHLKQQLAMKDTVIAAKDETIDLLKAAFNRPN